MLAPTATVSPIFTRHQRTHWSAATLHRATNKPLLLTIIDLFAQGLIAANWIEPAGQWPR